ncbi:MAG: ATP-binding protein [Actinobacteria bacterium]|nr:ATP-binding protein [Actinomycetota bacterium]
MINEQILNYLKKLRLSSHMVQISDSIEASSHQEFLLKLLQAEHERRETAKNDRLTKLAGFYTLKAFDAFKFDEVTLPEGVTPQYLKDLKFLETATNIVMYGNVGSGKTHLSIALGLLACSRGINTKFYRTSALVNRLAEAKKAGELSRFLAQLSKVELLVCDEWGYVPLDRIGSQILFEVVSECYEKKSLIINTNIEFSRWVNVFYDEQMTGAIIDRVLHHCHLLLFPGPSNRLDPTMLR